MKTGSPEWFNEEAGELTSRRMPIDTERLRAAFFARFSPKALSEMTGEQLLKNVFGNSESCMIRLLMFDGSYRWFGAAGKYSYHGVLYNKNGTWTYKEGSRTAAISYSDAAIKAEYLRDKLLECINAIIRIGRFETINDYEKLDRALSGVFFSKYTWVAKYYQMIFPHIIPGMYSDDTLVRALGILGLPDHGSRILNMGEIALFTRRCDVNNIKFNTVFDDQWTFHENRPPCENAAENYKTALSKAPVINDNLSYYSLSPVAEIIQKASADTPISYKAPESVDPKPSVKPDLTPKAALQDDFKMPELYEGSKVTHGKYGDGVITKIEKDGAQIVVSFAECEKSFCTDVGNSMNAFRKGFLKLSAE
ncbi:MAG: hypothetical protein J6P98_05190 [Clostridia bacterium]|nr:hypothetical protein [Clostridia bacterium]